MSALRRACARLLSLFRREALDREFDEEAQSHLDLAVEDYVRRGTSEAEARRLARISHQRHSAVRAVRQRTSARRHQNAVVSSCATRQRTRPT